MTHDDITIIAAALFAISEALSLIPAIRSNGVLQLVFSIIRRVAGRA
jgi:hypothetical protein